MQKDEIGTKPRRTRTVRGKGHPVALTPRDVDLLLLVGVCRYASSEQLAREFFPSADRCRRRLRDLYDAGYLAITLTSSRAPNLVSLTALALKTLTILKNDATSRIRLPGTIRFAGVAHHLAIVDARLYLSALGRTNGAPIIRWGNAGGQMEKELGFERLKLEPDGLVEFEVSGGVLRYAIEVDCGTETSRVIASKLERYREAMTLGLAHEIWWVVTTTARREHSLATLIDNAGLAPVSRVLPQELLTTRPLTMPPPILPEVAAHAATPKAAKRRGEEVLSDQALRGEGPTDDRRVDGRVER